MRWALAIAAILAGWAACLVAGVPAAVAVAFTVAVGVAAVGSWARSLRWVVGRFRVAAAIAPFALAAATPPLWMGVVQGRLVFVRESTEAIRRTDDIVWRDGRPAEDKIGKLDDLRLRIDAFNRRGTVQRVVDFVAGGGSLPEQALRAYARGVGEGFVRPCMSELEHRFRRAAGRDYAAEHQALKAYLVLTGARKWSPASAGAVLGPLWVEIFLPTARSARRLEAVAGSVVVDYLQRVAAGEIHAPAPDAASVEAVRRVLRSKPSRERAFALLVGSVRVEPPPRPAGPLARRFPSISLGKLFIERLQALRAIGSRSYDAGQDWPLVEGPYTAEGRARVVENFGDARAILERDAWVEGLEGSSGGMSIDALQSEYERRSVHAWRTWMLDLRIRRPASIAEAVDVYRRLTEDDPPLATILRLLAEHTQPRLDWRGAPAAAPNAAETFASTVAFWGRPDKTVPVATVPPGPLGEYLDGLRRLRASLEQMRGRDPHVTPEAASEPLGAMVALARRLLEPHDELARQILTPLLLDPLSIAGIRPPESPTDTDERSTAIDTSVPRVEKR